MTSCRACGETTDPVFEMAPMPLAGAFAETAEDALAAERYPLTWARCRRCSLVNVWPDIPDDRIYATYSYAASDVPALVRHHEEYARFLKVFRGYIPSRILEIGGNDGVLLTRLPEEWDKVNVDPSDIAKTSKQLGYWLVNEPFTSELAGALGKFDLITSSNAFAHFSGIGDAWQGVKRALAPHGRFVIEVHDLEATLASSTWDTVYHEHKCEWSLDSLRAVGAMYGLRLVRVTRLPLHGGLIRAEFVHGTPPAHKPLRQDFKPLLRAYIRRKAPDLPDGWWAYGAAARATVYLNQLDLHPRVVIDGSPRRHGRWVPGVGVPIHPPERLDDVGWNSYVHYDQKVPPAVLITAWNHADDIKARHPDYQGRWVAAWDDHSSSA